MFNRDTYIPVLTKLKGYYKTREGYPFKWEDPCDEESMNIHFLADAGLVEIQRIDVGPAALLPRRRHADFKWSSYEHPTGHAWIKQKGFDFLRDDGGLSSELSTVTVRLHQDTIDDIRDLLIRHIENDTNISTEEKAKWITLVDNLKSETIKQVTTRLISMGLDTGAAKLQALKALFPSDG